MPKGIGYGKKAIKKLGKKKVEELRKKKGMKPSKDFYMMAKKSGRR